MVFAHRHAATRTSCSSLITEQLNCSSTMADIEPVASTAVAERLVSPTTLDVAWPDSHSKLSTQPADRENSATASSTRPAAQGPPNFAGIHAHAPCPPNSNPIHALRGRPCQHLHS